MKYLIGCLFLFSLSAYGQSEKIDLSQNYLIQGLNYNVEGEAVKKGYLGRSFLPSLILEFGQERFQTGRYKEYGNPYGLLEARINLFRGGRDSIESEARNINARIAEYNKSISVREQLNKARKVQWQIVYNNSLIRIFEEELKENLKIKVQAERRARSGVATRSDTLEFDIYRNELEENIESLKHENLILKLGLVPLLGLEANQELQFADQIQHEHDDALMSKSFEAKTFPVVNSLNAEYDSYLLQEKTNNLWWTPRLDLYGGYYMYTLRDRDYLQQSARDDRVIGARITFELFDGLRSYNQATAFHYQAKGKQLQARHAERQTEAQYLMLKEDLLHTHEVMHYVEERIKKSRDYMKVTLQEYDRGVKNSLDALVAMQRFYKYEKQLLEKKKEYQVIKADILQLRGE